MNDIVVVVTLIKKERAKVIMMVYVPTFNEDMMVVVGGEVDEDNAWERKKEIEMIKPRDQVWLTITSDVHTLELSTRPVWYI